MDFEFNQSTTVSSNGVTPVRTAGDVLIKYDLSQGGVNPVLGFHRWVTTGTPSVVCDSSNTVPCWGPVQPLGGNFEASINTVPVIDPIAPDAPRTLSVRTFGEAAINLTDSGILPPGTCSGFGRAYLKSRSSDTFTSALKDFIAPIAVNIRNCGQIIIHKQTDPNGASGSFGFTATGGLDPATFSLSDDGTRDYGSTVQAGSYSVTEDDPTPGFDLTDISCTATGSGTSFTKDVGTRKVDMTLAVDGVIECTYTNTQRGHIKIDKVTDPGGSLQAFDFSLTGGPSALNQSFTLTDGSTPHDSGAILPGSGYSAAETVPTGWDLTSATCDDNSPVTNISVSAGETVTCTFNDRARGAVAIHKTDDAGHALAGATFELFTDNAPLDGAAPHGAEDTATGKTCTTNASGDCTIDDVVPGQYWIVETVTPAGHDSAADRNVTVNAGQTVSVTLENPRRFKIIVLVCRDSDNTLYPSTVTVDSTDKTSLAAGGGGAIADADLCALDGASYDGKHTGSHPANVSIPVNP